MRSNLVPARGLFFGFFGLGVAALLASVGYLVYCAYTLPVTPASGADSPPAATLYATTHGVPFVARGAHQGSPIAADRLPENLVDAVIAIEDRRFYRHIGVDLRGVMRAAWNNLQSRAIEGGSTITQQLARVTYLSHERSLRRKVQEAMLALWLESRLSKEEILARYLNAVYFGAGAVGADAAAKRYFDKSASELDLAEAAMLAGLIRAPSQLAPTRDLEAARRRAELVLDAMVETGAIDETQAQTARKNPARLALAPEPHPDYNFFIDVAEAEIKSLIGSPPIDMSVTTTFEPQLQEAAQRTVKYWLDGEGARRNVGQAALVAMAPDGAILALVGGRDYGESQFNRVTQARRQPGSLFKTFVYLAALSNGYQPDSEMIDQPVQIGDWEPKNYDGRHRGLVTLRTAFAQSINSVAVQLLQAVGVERVIAMAKSLGVESELPADPGLALGTAEVTLLEMVRAIDAVATNNKSIEPYTVRAIRTRSAALFTRPETVAEPADWNWAAIMNLLEAVVSEGTGQAARLDQRSAGKTGTTDDYRDAWFVGFTSDIVVGVWVGNDDNSPMAEVTGGDIPAKIWHDFVVQAQKFFAAQPDPDRLARVAETSGTSAPPQSRSTAAAPAQPAASADTSPRRLRGIPQVVDSGTLILDGEPVRLRGVEGETGDPANELARYLAGRAVDCTPVDADTEQYRCRIGAYDVSEAVLLNGAGRAAADAPKRLRTAEQKARKARRGVWAQ